MDKIEAQLINFSLTLIGSGAFDREEVEKAYVDILMFATVKYALWGEAK
jgi:hypothetical protein